MTQTMVQQVSDPLGVFDIRLPSRHSFDMLGIDHQHFKTAFQQVEHRLPIDPGCDLRPHAYSLVL